jgi:uncharacterized delta-60 repeat protein
VGNPTRPRAFALFLALTALLAFAAVAAGKATAPPPLRVIPVPPKSDNHAAPSIWDLAAAPGGGFVAAITDPNFGQGYFGAARFRSDGSLDRGFGRDGYTPPLPSPAHKESEGIAVEPDGGLVLAGYRRREEDQINPILARYTAAGHLDRRFGEGGVVETQVGEVEFLTEALHAVAIAPDGTILAVGATDEKTVGVSQYGYSVGGPTGFVVAYNPDGSLDTAFGQGGHVYFPPTTETKGVHGYTGLRSIVVEPDGKILVAGFQRSRLFLARLEPDGSPDPGFGGGDGQLVVPTGEEGLCYGYCYGAAPVAVLADGSIVALASGEFEQPQLVRLLPDGSPLPGFGRAGVIDLPRKGRFLPLDMVVAGGRLVVPGWEEEPQDGVELAFGVRRYDLRGHLDRAFGKGGVESRPRGTVTAAFAALPRPDGGAWVGGSISGNRPNALLLGRYPAP